MTTDQPADRDGSAPAGTAHPRKRRFGEVLKHPIVSGLIVTVIGSAIVAVLVQRDGDGSAPSPPSTNGSGAPLTFTVGPDRDFMSNSGFSMAVPGSFPRGRPSPKADCFKARRWLIGNGGADVGVTRLKVVLDNPGSSTVTVIGARVDVVDRIESNSETVLECPSGGSVDVTSVGFNLDAGEPRALTTDGYSLGDNYFPEHSLNVEPGKPETLSVSAFSKTCRCRWRLVLELSVDGRTPELVISDDGKPFATVGPVDDGAARYYWGFVPCADKPSPCRLD